MLFSVISQTVTFPFVSQWCHFDKRMCLAMGTTTEKINDVSTVGLTELYITVHNKIIKCTFFLRIVFDQSK